MRKATRLTLLAIVGLVTLAFAGSAFAAYAPKLFVNSVNPAAGAGGGVTIRAVSSDSEDPTAKVTIYVPTGFQLSNSAAVGSSLGKIDAHASAADLGGAKLPLIGDLIVANPNDPAIVSASNLCDPGTHYAVWNLHMTAAGQVLDVPVFVDQTSGTEAAFSGYRLVICLPPPDVPAGTPGRATFGAKLLDATFGSSAFTNPVATGEYRWRSKWTPYVPKIGQVNALGTVEAQSVVLQPRQVILQGRKSVVKKKVKGRIVRTTYVTLTGSLTENLKGLGGVSVTLTSGTSASALKAFKVVTTNTGGGFSVKLKVTRTTVYGANATLADRDLGATGCTATFAPVPCTDATIAANVQYVGTAFATAPLLSRGTIRVAK